MTKREELDVFVERAEELIRSKYILADIKIVGILKAIAASGIPFRDRREQSLSLRLRGIAQKALCLFLLRE